MAALVQKVSVPTERTPSIVRAFGVNGVGDIPTGTYTAVANDLIVAAVRVSDLTSQASSFSTTVTTTGLIHQSSSSDLSVQEFWFVIIPQS